MNHTKGLKAAFIHRDITPDFPVELIGCYRADNRGAEAAAEDQRLLAQGLVFSCGKECYALITIDSLGLTTALSDRLRTAAAQVLGTEKHHIMVNFSHTHSAPAPLSPINGTGYYKLLEEKVTELVEEGRGKLTDCFITWDVTESDFAENRRGGCDKTDGRLLGIQFRRADNSKPIGTVLRLSCHANVLMTHSNSLSSDFFGPVRHRLGEQWDNPVMIMQGAGGNLKPRDVDMIYGGTQADLKVFVDKVCACGQKLRFEQKDVDCSVEMISREMNFISHVPSAETAEKIAYDAETLFGTPGSLWLKECARLREEGVKEQTVNTEVQFLFLGGLCLCGIPDEVFCEIALAAAEKTSPLLFLNGVTNGCTSYLAHEEEWEKGGYETLYSFLSYYQFHGHVMPFRKETAAEVVALVCKTYRQYKRGTK